MSESVTHPFDELVQQPDGQIRLALAALLFARDTYPHLAIPGYLDRLDGLAQRVNRLAGKNPCDRLAVMRRVICEEAEFSANIADYYDPRNSYLNEVLDRRRGIPISLSTVWLDIARTLNYPLAGVNFPGHFLLCYRSCSGPIYVDAFTGGSILDEEDLRERLCQQVKMPTHMPPEFVSPAGTKAILMRMLNNLLGIYMQRSDWRAAEPILARQVALCPEDADLWCRRGLVYLNLHQCACAVACFERSLELTGCHPDAVKIQQYLINAKRRLTHSN